MEKIIYVLDHVQIMFMKVNVLIHALKNINIIIKYLVLNIVVQIKKMIVNTFQLYKMMMEWHNVMINVIIINIWIIHVQQRQYAIIYIQIHYQFVMSIVEHNMFHKIVIVNNNVGLNI